ncbi:uncharacterized protein LOC144618662 [Crassostrea virginica]
MSENIYTRSGSTFNTSSLSKPSQSTPSVSEISAESEIEPMSGIEEIQGSSAEDTGPDDVNNNAEDGAFEEADAEFWFQVPGNDGLLRAQTSNGQSWHKESNIRR